MAKRSATECAAALDVCRVRKLADPKRLEVGREILLRVVSMLIRMIHGLETNANRGGNTRPEPINPSPPNPR
jgi:hypothetical protein